MIETFKRLWMILQQPGRLVSGGEYVIETEDDQHDIPGDGDQLDRGAQHNRESTFRADQGAGKIETVFR